MNNPLLKHSWSPYLVGVGIGMLSWFAFWSADHPLGITTAFEHTAAMILEAAIPGLAESNSYYQEQSPKIGWQWMLVVGVLLGSVISSFMSGDREPITVPPLWQSRFGASAGLRLTVALLSAGLMIFGARLAKGCTSGHGISGNLQLAASSWLFSFIFFAVAVLTAFLMYGRSVRDV
ncbi:YeeE/YedE thiosulfate transporter family protein [Allorhodopirellula solitaria]|uniref:Putative inner membrane protein n=1 Tax=Allorhodopirellula solitaria TaxID=2527987 RepID=A0A5C5WM14_9BACT|nr:YeeE/YedE thiosulfate transporter family protein [Allorhodopirellula solitaria]TWT51650.1 putative inner membrane protein [Allorhodopirellula solitaria]